MARCRCKSFGQPEEAEELNDPRQHITVESLLRTFRTGHDPLSAADARRLYETINTAHHPSEIDEAMDLANQLLHGHGVEAIHAGHVDNYYYDVRLLYVNQGDPYIPTILYDTEYNTFGIGSWGGWMQWAEEIGEIDPSDVHS